MRVLEINRLLLLVSCNFQNQQQQPTTSQMSRKNSGACCLTKDSAEDADNVVLVELVSALSRLDYVLVLGPANAGKTEFFCTQQKYESKIILSPVCSSKLTPLSHGSSDYFSLMSVDVLEVKPHSSVSELVDNIVKRVADDATVAFLVDELHFFTPSDFVTVIKALGEIQQNNCTRRVVVFVSLLPGNCDRNPISRPPVLVAYVLAAANCIQLITGTCHVCRENKTTLSARATLAPSSNFVVDKRLFAATCFACDTSKLT